MHGSSADLERPATHFPRTKTELLASVLVTFIFVINCVFAVYMLAQFFVPKPYSTTDHIGYSLIVLGNTCLLGYSARCFWQHRAKRGCYAFFTAIGASFVANAVLEYLLY